MTGWWIWVAESQKGASIRQPVILIDSAVLALVSLETIRVRDLLMMVRRIFQHVSW